MNLEKLTNEVLEGKQINREEAFYLYEQPLQPLCESANRIRKHYCGDNFDICSIINAKSGCCSENCKFCSQSAFSNTNSECYPLLSQEEIVKGAQKSYEEGIQRYSIVTAGKRLRDSEVDIMCQAIKRIKQEIGIAVCVSFGLLSKEQFARLKDAGVTRIHNNLETSQKNFSNICTTHTFSDKVRAIKDAQSVGLTVCSGGIMGLGESVEDRIDMALTLRELGIESVPVNMLNPIKGTPFENNKRLTSEDMERIIAVYRFILPRAYIRLAGGRGLLEDKGKGCFLSGANAAISGDMLTTSGISAKTDIDMLTSLNYKVEVVNE